MHNWFVLMSHQKYFILISHQPKSKIINATSKKFYCLAILVFKHSVFFSVTQPWLSNPLTNLKYFIVIVAILQKKPKSNIIFCFSVTKFAVVITSTKQWTNSSRFLRKKNLKFSSTNSVEPTDRSELCQSLPIINERGSKFSHKHLRS